MVFEKKDLKINKINTAEIRTPYYPLGKNPNPALKSKWSKIRSSHQDLNPVPLVYNAVMLQYPFHGEAHKISTEIVRPGFVYNKDSES